MMRIIQRIDQVGDADVEIVPLQNASAAEVVRVVNSLYQGSGRRGRHCVKVVADERSNSVLISGDQSQRLRVRALIAHLDTPLERRRRHPGALPALRRCREARAEAQGADHRASPQAAGAGGAAAAPRPQAQAEKNATIWADPPTTRWSSPRRRRSCARSWTSSTSSTSAAPQVLVEAIIVDVNVDKDAELGVNWAAFATTAPTFPPAPSSPRSAARASSIWPARSRARRQRHHARCCRAPRSASAASAAPASTSPPCCAPSAATPTTNVIATPSAVTMDNQEAELKVAQEVPFITGQFTNTAAPPAAR